MSKYRLANNAWIKKLKRQFKVPLKSHILNFPSLVQLTRLVVKLTIWLWFLDLCPFWFYLVIASHLIRHLWMQKKTPIYLSFFSKVLVIDTWRRHQWLLKWSYNHCYFFFKFCLVHQIITPLLVLLYSSNDDVMLKYRFTGLCRLYVSLRILYKLRTNFLYTF